MTEERAPLGRMRVRAHKRPFRQRVHEGFHRVQEAGERSAPFFLALAALIIPAIGLLSFLPGESKHMLHTQGRYHSWGHLVIFVVIGFVLVRAGRNDVQRRWLFIGAMVLGFAIEVGEHLAYGSPLEWKDVFVDVTGAVGGTLAALATLLELQQRHSDRRRAA